MGLHSMRSMVRPKGQGRLDWPAGVSAAKKLMKRRLDLVKSRQGNRGTLAGAFTCSGLSASTGLGLLSLSHQGRIAAALGAQRPLRRSG